MGLGQSVVSQVAVVRMSALRVLVSYSGFAGLILLAELYRRVEVQDWRQSLLIPLELIGGALMLLLAVHILLGRLSVVRKVGDCVEFVGLFGRPAGGVFRSRPEDKVIVRLVDVDGASVVEIVGNEIVTAPISPWILGGRTVTRLRQGIQV